MKAFRRRFRTYGIFLLLVTVFAYYSFVSVTLSRHFRVLNSQSLLDTNVRDSGYPHLTICVITYNRLLALQRLLLSLNHARYHEHVDLRISVEAGAPSDLLRYVETFVWLHGSKTVHVRVVRAGLIPAVVESWFPANDNCYGVLLEDDLEVSPYFYEWLMFALAMIKKTDMHNRVFGISLYTPRVIETVNPYRTFLPDVEFPHSPAFLQQMPCSWGAMFFPDAWKKYIKYLHHRLIYNGSLLVPNSRTNGWVGSWKKYFVELAWAEALFMLYPNFKNQTSFSTNYVEQGAHVVLGDKLHTRSMYTVPLHTTDSWLENQDFSFPLPLLDVLGNPYKAEKSANDLSKHCRQISSGHTGIKSGSALKSQFVVGNKLVSGYVLPPEYKLVSIPRNGSFFVGTMTSTGLFTIDHCLIGGKHQCSGAGHLGIESTLPNSTLSISRDGKIVIAPFGCTSIECRVIWQSDGGHACSIYVLHLQDNGLLTLHCGCGCHGREPIWMSGKGSYQPVNCSTQENTQPVLLPHSSLSSLSLNTLLSNRDSKGQYIEAVMQEDGNFVLYLNPSPTIHPVFNIPTHFEAQSFFFEVASDGNLQIVGQTGQERHILWENKFHGEQMVPHFFVVTHSGAMAVFEGYGACEYGEQVWAMNCEPACSSLAPKCSNPATAQKQLMCGQVTPDIYNLLARQNSYAVLVSTEGRNNALLQRSISHLSLSPQVSCILIVSLEPFEHGFGPYFINGKLVKYLQTYTKSPNNKFYPSVHITTEAVLLLDEGVLIHHDDLNRLFLSWTRHKSKLVGFFPYFIDIGNGSGVSILSTRAVMLHKNRLFEYACLTSPAMHKIVDEFHDCEDVALHLHTSRALSGTMSLHLQLSYDYVSDEPARGGVFSNLENSTRTCLHCLQRMLGASIPL